VLAKILKESFVPMFDQLFESLMSYSDEQKDINDNIQLLGVLADCFKYVPSLILKYAKKITALLLES
jgi:hypothetical protein